MSKKSYFKMAIAYRWTIIQYLKLRKKQDCFAETEDVKKC